LTTTTHEYYGKKICLPIIITDTRKNVESMKHSLKLAKKRKKFAYTTKRTGFICHLLRAATTHTKKLGTETSLPPSLVSLSHTDNTLWNSIRSRIPPPLQTGHQFDPSCLTKKGTGKKKVQMFNRCISPTKARLPRRLRSAATVLRKEQSSRWPPM